MVGNVSVVYVEPPSPPAVTAYRDYRLYLADYSGFFQATRAMSDACGQIIRIRTKHRRFDGKYQFTQRKVKTVAPSNLEYRYETLSQVDAKLADHHPVEELRPRVVEVEGPLLPYIDPSLVKDIPVEEICNKVLRSSEHNFYSTNEQFHACSAAGFNAFEFKQLCATDALFSLGIRPYVNLVIDTKNHARYGFHDSDNVTACSCLEDSKAQWLSFVAPYIATD